MSRAKYRDIISYQSINKMNALITKLQKSNEVTVGVIGDLMLDKYILGYSERISPESPVPIVVVNEEFWCLGGAGNVVANVRSLNGKAIPIGTIGSDRAGERLIKEFRKQGCPIDYVIKTRKKKTTTKTRILAQGQQVLRVDDEDTNPCTNEDVEMLITFSRKTIDESDIVIVSDYGKGCCVPELIKEAIGYANEKRVPILVDPRKRGGGFDMYRNSSCITPNLKETRYVVPSVINEDDDIEDAARYISSEFNIENVIITRSEKGMSVFSGDNKVDHFHARAREVFDVSGAGDTVIATLGICLALGMCYTDSAMIANIAAGIVVSHRGTTPVTSQELNAQLAIEK